MMATAEVKTWPDSLPAGSSIGVDEGGLCLVLVGEDGKAVDGTWCDVGGLPEVNDPVLATPAEIAACLPEAEGGIC